MVYGVEDGARKPLRGTQRDAEDHITNVADQGKRQKALNIGLRDGAQNTHQHRGEGYPHEHGIEPTRSKDGGAGADDGVDTHLGQQAGKDGRDQRRCRGIGVRQPGIQRDHGGLNAKGDEQRGKDSGASSFRNVLHALANLCHVHRAHGGIHIPQREQEDHG